ncbi:hypothetical protein [Actinopolymorpha sp. B9G3]|uniref:hypothetical protein n=1 Tax=Actinopolymorpha sp. B9G3 TaxID=3158970 RepID=UPI0032D8CF8D
MAAGIAVRLVLWWQDRAFWRDELGLVQSLDAYPAAALLGRLADTQSAPPLWLLVVRAVTAVAGDGERTYRLVTLGSGCALLVLVAVLGIRLVRYRWAIVVPLILLATLSELVFYTVQTKQYATDALAVTWLVLLGVLLLARGAEPTVAQGGEGGDGVGVSARHSGFRRTDLWWYASLVVLPWLSHAFMLAAPLVAGWVTLVRTWRGEVTLRRAAGWLVAPAVSVLAAALYARHLTSQAPDFLTYWAAFLGPSGHTTHGGGLAGWWDWHRFVFGEFAVRELGFPTTWGAALVVVGALIAFRRGAAIAMLLVLPLVAAYTVGVLGLYPFGRRLVLFCVPSLLLCLGILVDAVAGRAVRVVRGWTARSGGPSGWPAVGDRMVAAVAGTTTAAAVLAVCWTPPTRLVHDLTYLYGVDDYRGALSFVAAKWEPGDVLLVGNGDRAAVRVYAPRLHLPLDRAYRAIPTATTTPRADCPLPRELAAARRIWLVTGDVVPLYDGVPSRYALVSPLLPRFRVVWFQDKGLVTVQAVIPGPTPDARPTRCLDYAPVGPAGSPALP